MGPAPAVKRLRAYHESRYNPLVSQSGKATRGFVHGVGCLRCLGTVTRSF